MVENRRRRSFTLSRKFQILEEQRREHLSGRAICDRYGLQLHQLENWKTLQRTSLFTSKRKRSMNNGPKSVYSEHENAIRDFVLLKRSEGTVVNIRSIIYKLHELSMDSRSKSFKANQMWAYRFLLRNGFSLRRITHVVTIDDAILSERRDNLYLEVQRRYNSNSQVVFVNMDQASLVFDQAGPITVDSCGARAVQIRTNARQQDRVSVALSVASNGDKLRPFVIFKGTADGRVAREFSRRENPYPQELIYTTNQNAWMTERAMQDWIRQILLPYADRLGRRRICLVLDSFQVHLKETIRESLRNEVIDVVYIPGGLTGEFQPLDIGINGPFKHYIREFTINQSDFQAQTASEKRHWLAVSIQYSWSTISTETVVNSFNRLLCTTIENIEEADEVE